MVKTKHGGARRLRKRAEQQAKVTAQSKPEPDQETEGPAPPSHLQRKVTKHMKFYDKVAASKASALAARPSIHKRSKRRREAVPASLTDYSALLGSLEGAAQQAQAVSQGRAAKQKRGLGRGGGKARTKITVDETVRLQRVLQHPSFQADPLAAVRAHLDSTLPAAASPPKPPRQKAKKKSPAAAAMQED
ncbi:hypothetical protein WJX84_000968 [Apatococcus fuscideae]|uniref:Ribosome biogenesis protein SLX9 n=1 Tax=Apatococcus fuscideae TaxID=2026836 RepID=A0AAW1TA21_9CHLO